MTNSNPAGGLLDLIERKRNGRSNPEMARDSGGLLQPTHFSNLKSKGVRGFPQPDSIRGYAKALGVSITDIVLAVAVSKGLEPGELGGASSSDLVIDGAGDLPEESRRLLRDTAAMMLWWQAKAEGVEESPAESVPTPEVDAADEWQVDHDLAAYEQGKTAEEKGRDHLDGLGEESQVAPDEDD